MTIGVSSVHEQQVALGVAWFDVTDACKPWIIVAETSIQILAWICTWRIRFEYHVFKYIHRLLTLIQIIIIAV